MCHEEHLADRLVCGALRIILILENKEVNSFNRWFNIIDVTHLQAGRKSNRLFYLSIPPNIFVDVVRCASLRASSESGWTRVIVEKPFGRDSESSAELTRCFKQYLTEEQIFR